MKIGIVLLVLALFFSCTYQRERCSEWHLVFRNDKSGNAVFGDKSELIRLARAGYPVRVGFGGRSSADSDRSVEHIADCQFLTVRNASELYAQIAPIIGQRPNVDGSEIKFRENYQWSIIVGTNGFSDRINTFLPSDSVAGHNSRPTNVSWFVNGPLPEDYEPLAGPLWEE
ncbi:MAG: hypothetical protein AAFQ94_16310 [Bacteroidota bacterium]